MTLTHVDIVQYLTLLAIGTNYYMYVDVKPNICAGGTLTSSTVTSCLGHLALFKTKKFFNQAETIASFNIYMRLYISKAVTLMNF